MTGPVVPDQFDVHPDMIGPPVVVDFDTGAVRMATPDEVAAEQAETGEDAWPPLS